MKTSNVRKGKILTTCFGKQLMLRTLSPLTLDKNSLFLIIEPIRLEFLDMKQQEIVIDTGNGKIDTRS